MNHYISSGSIRKRRDGRWEGRYIDADGHRHSLYGRKKSEVQGQLISSLSTVQEGTIAFMPVTSMGDLCERWLENAALTVRPKTLLTYRYLINLHIKPALGSIPVAKLTVLQVQGLLSKKHANGLSPRSVAHVRAVLRTVLNQAVRWDLVSRNVAALAFPPKLVRKQIPYLTADEARMVLRAARETDLEAIIRLALSLGLRQGEILGLRWSDLDVEKRSLHVRNALHRVNGTYALAETKTQKSQRTLALPESILQSLEVWRKKQRENRSAARDLWAEEIPDLIFTTVMGRPLHGSTVHHQFTRLLDRCGLSHRSFHSLRHTAATLALGQGVDLKTVSTMLGHSQISLTADTYAATLPALVADAAARIDDLLREDD